MCKLKHWQNVFVLIMTNMLTNRRNPAVAWSKYIFSILPTLKLITIFFGSVVLQNRLIFYRFIGYIKLSYIPLISLQTFLLHLISFFFQSCCLKNLCETFKIINLPISCWKNEAYADRPLKLSKIHGLFQLWLRLPTCYEVGRNWWCYNDILV